MRRLFLLSSLTAIVLIAAPATAAQESESQPEAAADRDPATMAALNRMGAALRKLENVSAHVDITAEDVLINDQKLQYGGTLEILAVRPTKLRMLLAMGRSIPDVAISAGVNPWLPRYSFNADRPAGAKPSRNSAMVSRLKPRRSR